MSVVVRKSPRALVNAGADPHAVSDSGTALTSLRGSAASCEEHPDKMLEMARTLIALGVPLEARDSLGWTALMGCDSPRTRPSFCLLMVPTRKPVPKTAPRPFWRPTMTVSRLSCCAPVPIRADTTIKARCDRVRSKVPGQPHLHGWTNIASSDWLAPLLPTIPCLGVSILIHIAHETDRVPRR